jgi:hypothetical protein
MDWYDWFKGTFKTSLFLTMNDSVFLQSFSLWQSAQFQKDKTAESIEYITVTQFYILPYHGDDLDIYIYILFLFGALLSTNPPTGSVTPGGLRRRGPFGGAMARTPGSRRWFSPHNP